MSKTLVVYYSLSWITKRVAEAIAKTKKFDLKEIQLEKPISTLEAYTKWFFLRNSKNPPKLKEDIDISKYDTIYIWTPIWFYTTTPAIRSFIKDKDFKWKKAVPFCTDGWKCGSYFRVMEDLLKDAEIWEWKEFQFVNRISDEDLLKQIEDWIK